MGGFCEGEASPWKEKEHAEGLSIRASAATDDLPDRVRWAIGDLRDRGDRVSFYTVAQRAQIARSTLYRRDDLKRLVMSARESMSARRAVPLARAPSLYESFAVYWVCSLGGRTRVL